MRNFPIHYRVCHVILCSMVIWSLSGCSKPQQVGSDAILIKVGTSTMSPLDFNLAFELHKTAYDPDTELNPEEIKTARVLFLQQMVERMTLLERAKELRLKVTPKELKDAVEKLTANYPAGEFEKALLESSISFETWRKELSDRLLMQKVVEEDLKKTIAVSSHEITEKLAVQQHSDQSGAAVDEVRVMEQLKSEKAESVYPQWIQRLQEKYTLEINKEKWNEILNG